MRWTRFVLITLVGCSHATPGGDDDVVDVPPDAADGDQPDSMVVDHSRVYGHSGQFLYRLETSTHAVTQIGPFGAATGDQSITDIAIDKDDRMIGVTLDKIFEIDPETGTATFLADFEGPGNLTSLSFVPLDLANPDGPERLVAATDQGGVLEIDQASGATTPLGSYGTAAAGTIRSSGDIVAVAGFGIYATVTIGDDLTAPDYLAQINPQTWAATPLGTGTPYDRIFGIGFWRNKLYGFVDLNAQGGAIIELDRNTGAATPVNSGTVRWYGAGVTTDAPVID